MATCRDKKVEVAVSALSCSITGGADSQEKSWSFLLVMLRCSFRTWGRRFVNVNNPTYRNRK